VKPEEQVAANI